MYEEEDTCMSQILVRLGTVTRALHISRTLPHKTHALRISRTHKPQVVLMVHTNRISMSVRRVHTHAHMCVHTRG